MPRDDLIGADGARSTVRRTLGIGSVATLRHAPGLLPHRGRDRAVLRLHLHARHRRLLRLRATSCRRATSPSSARSSTRRRSGRTRSRTRCSTTLREACPLGESVKREAWVALSRSRTPRDVVPGAGRVLLAGEAGGFMSPTSGEGISYALNTGRLAGQRRRRARVPTRRSPRTPPRPRHIAAQHHGASCGGCPFMESRAGQVPRRLRADAARHAGSPRASSRPSPVRR